MAAPPSSAAVAVMILNVEPGGAVPEKALPAAEGIEGGGPLLPPEIEQVAPDLVKKYMMASSETKPKLACEAIDRCIKELQKQLAAAKKAG